jgi:hypothetical protein
MKKYTKTTIFTLLSIILVFSIAGCSPRTEQVDNNIKDETNNTEQRKDNIASTTKKNNKEKTDISDKKEWQGELINEEDHWKKYVNDYYGIEFRFRDDEDILYVRYENKNSFTIGCKDVIEKCPFDILGTTGFSFSSYLTRHDDDMYKNNYENLRDYLDYAWKSYLDDAKLAYIKKIPNDFSSSIYEVKVNFKYYFKPTIEHPEKIVDAHDIKYYIEYHNLKDKDYLEVSCDISKDICREALTSFKIIE